MNGQHEQGGQGGQDSHLAFLLNAANGQNALMGYPGINGVGRYGVSDASLEEQILQRASALRAEALMQQQQQQQHQQQRQHQLGAALAALQQQQQLSSLAGLNHNFAGLSAQEQEALLGRAAALRELGISGGNGALHGGGGGGMERLQQLELGRLEELERRRQQLAALANLSNGSRPADGPQGGEQLGHDSAKSDIGAEKEPQRVPKPSAEKSKDELRKTPGTVIVPCRARGMPMDHNFKVSFAGLVLKDHVCREI
jgi:multidrug efflux pump subunit AcrA (membrane-fusion protein)